MKKFLSAFFIFFIVTLNLFLPISVFADDPTIEITLNDERELLNSKKWRWDFSINTTGVTNGTEAEVHLLKGGMILEGPVKYFDVLNNNFSYSTYYTLDEETHYRVLVKIPTFEVENDFVKTTPKSTLTGQIETFQTEVQEFGLNENPGDGVYRLLAPIGKFQFAPDNIGEYFNTILTIAIGLCAVLAVIMIVIGGIQYMGDESIFGKTQAKEKITKAILGLLIALGSYALLNTINPDLLGGNINIKQVTVEIDPEVHSDVPHSPINGKYCNGKFTAGQTWPVPPTAEEQAIRNALLEKGITVNKKACKNVGESNCTSVAGLNISKVIELKTKCGADCPIEITGGTECWLHSNKTEHLPGNSIVDLNFTRSPNLVKYIEEGSVKTISSYKKFPVYTKDGMSFLKETTHYHVISW